MLSFGRTKIAEAAKELAEHLQVVENIKALQVGQKELADAVKSLGDRIRTMETEFRALRAEAIVECLRETQAIVNSVQGGLNHRIETLAVKVGIIQSGLANISPIDGSPDQKHISADQRTAIGEHS